MHNYSSKRTRERRAPLNLRVRPQGGIVKRLVFAILVLLSAPVSAQQAHSSVPHQKEKMCQVGATSYALKDGEECINTAQKCHALQGVWGGTVSGRGRSPGCTLPTKDAGRACSGPGQCEGYCAAGLTNTSPQVASATQPEACACSTTSRIPKGTLVGLCTEHGAQWIHLD